MENTPKPTMCESCIAIQQENSRLQKELAGMYRAVCPDCGGTGSLGRCSDGRLQSCETCGGHEDSLGTGFVGEIPKIEALQAESQRYRTALEKNDEIFASIMSVLLGEGGIPRALTKGQTLFLAELIQKDRAALLLREGK